VTLLRGIMALFRDDGKRASSAIAVALQGASPKGVGGLGGGGAKCSLGPDRELWPTGPLVVH
jgi:hypothetical protein